MLFSLSGCASYSPMPLSSSNITRAFSMANLRKDPVLYKKLTSHKPLNLDELAKIAILNNKSLITFRDSLGIAKAQIIKARTIPNPGLSLSASRPVMGNIAGTTDPYGISPSFNIGFLFARGADIDSAKLNFKALQMEAAYREWETAEKTKLIALKLLFMRKAEKNYSANVTVYKRKYKSLKYLYHIGLATITELNFAENNMEKAESNLLKIKKTAKSLEIELRDILGLPYYYRLNIPYVQAKLKIPSVHALDKDIKNRIDLEAFKIAYRAREERLREAILKQFPSISIRTPFSNDSSNVQTIGLGISISIPLFDRNQASIAKEKATRKMMFDDYVARLQTAKNKIGLLSYDIKNILSQIILAKNTLKNLDRLFKVYKNEFNKREIGMFKMSSIENNLLDEQIKLIILKENYYNAAVSLEILSGTTIIK